MRCNCERIVNVAMGIDVAREISRSTPSRASVPQAPWSFRHGYLLQAPISTTWTRALDWHEMKRISLHHLNKDVAECRPTHEVFRNHLNAAWHKCDPGGHARRRVGMC